MHAGRHYSLREVMVWTRREIAVFLLIGAVPTLLHQLAGWRWIGVSWPPIALLGTAVAFMTGFKNNASYGRLWEARQVWGAIVNGSRAFAFLVLDYVPDEAARRRIFQRHFAWLTALRYQLREPRVWENMKHAPNAEYRRQYRVDEWETPLDGALAPLLEAGERNWIMARKNRAAQLMNLQSRDVSRNRAEGAGGELGRVELQRAIAALIDAQGRCERLKNYPYPRQFATLNLFFVWLFVILLPFAMLPDFERLGRGFAWLTIPFTVVIAWVFHTMDKIGGISENPFEGSPNDVPITSMSRAIEIDLREMLGETELPPPVIAVNNILM